MPRAIEPRGRKQLETRNNPLQQMDMSLPDPDTLAKQIAKTVEWFEKIGLAALEEITGLDLSALLPLLHAFDGIDLTDPGSILRAIANALQAFVAQLLTGQIPINVGGLFGHLPTNLFGEVPIGFLSNVQQNQLVNPGFDGSVSMSDPGAHFVYDAAVGRTSLGSARTTCNGVTHSLFSNAIAVAEGQTVHLESYVQWSGVTQTGGTPFSVQVARYLDGTRVGGYTTIGSVGGSGSGAWALCSGTDYVVPSGCDSIRMKLTCGAGATAGSVWFDDSKMTKSGLLQQSWVDGLLDKFLDLFDIFGGAVDTTGMRSFVTALLNGLGGTPGAGISQIITRLQHLGTGGAFDASQLGNFGGIPANAIGQGAISGLGTSLGALLPGTDFQDLLNKLYDGAKGTTGSTGKSRADVLTAFSGLFTTGIGASTATNASTAIADVAAGFKSLYDSWFGGTTATGTPTEVAATTVAIRAAVGDFTVQTFVASNASWAIDPALAVATEAYVGVTNGGGKGGLGAGVGNPSSGATYLGGAGGIDGGYVLVKVNPALLGGTSASLAVALGAAATTNGTLGTATTVTSSVLGLLATGIAGKGELASPTGYVRLESKPGSGGDGGSTVAGTSAFAGDKGESGAVTSATGGTGGTGSTGTTSGTGNAGSAGGAGQTSTLPIAGGGGGGGGGGRMNTGGAGSNTGGAGGAGGYPGGGSGGGGAATGAGAFFSSTGGSGGTPGAAFAFVMWR